MRTLLIGFAAAALAGQAGAQLVGGQAGLGGTVGGLGGVGATTGGAIEPTLPDASRAAGQVGDDAAGATGRAGRSANGATRAAASIKPIRVDAGASIRVDRGTRCYYDDYYYDPVYRDGRYYCERSADGVAARARVVPRR